MLFFTLFEYSLTIVNSALGTAHPPGYPLLTVVVYALRLIPYESVAYKVNALRYVISDDSM